MTVETITLGSLPSELNSALPAGGDPKQEGDDHIRNIKITLKNFYSVWVATNAEARLTALEAYVLTSDADTLGGQLPAYYLNVANMTAGILAPARLTGTYAINISGNAATATDAVEAVHALTADVATLASAAESVGGLTAAQIAASFAAVSRVKYTNPAIQNYSGTIWQLALSDFITITSREFLFVNLKMKFTDGSNKTNNNSPNVIGRILIGGVEVFRDSVYRYFDGHTNPLVVFNSRMLPYRAIMTSYANAYIIPWPAGNFEDIPIGASLPIEVYFRRALADDQNLQILSNAWSIDLVELDVAGLGVS